MKKASILICLTILLFSSCSLPSGGAYAIEVTTKSLKLEWDPSPNVFFESLFAISQYHVYSRSHGTTAWRFVGSIPASDNPSIELEHSDFGNGDYDFAVSAGNGTGGVSSLHSSMDASARPFGGWYIRWNYANE